MLEKHSYPAAQAQLGTIKPSNSQLDWTVNCALAIAEWNDNNLDGALDSFYAASLEKPDRGEFYYYYGRAMLDKGQVTTAAEQFRIATRYGAGFEQAQRYASLADAAYTPSLVLSAAFSILILLMLFTMHEYGHAFVA